MNRARWHQWPSVEALLPDLLSLSDGGRRITGVVLHHTAAPTVAQWQGDRSMAGMLDYWEQRRAKEGWSKPPGYHLLVAPGGAVYAPFRDLSRVLNANSDTDANQHCVAVSMVGNFDAGEDELSAEQHHAAIGTLAGVVERYRLPISHLHFHRDYPQAHKTCPGTGIDRTQVRGSVLLAQPWARRLL